MEFKIILAVALTLFVHTNELVIEYVDNNNSNFTEIKRVYSPYQNKLLKPRISNKIVSNLNQNLDIFENCMVHFINYDGIDFVPFTKPVILSRYDVVWFIYKVQSEFIFTDIKNTISLRRRYFPIEKVPQNDTKIAWCQNHHIDRECMDIPYVDLGLSTKQWYCEAHIYLFPPNYAEFYETDKWYNKNYLLVPGSFKKLFWNLKLKTNAAEPGQGVYYPDSFAQVYSLIDTRERFDILLTFNRNIANSWKNSLIDSFAYISTKSKQEMLVFSTNAKSYNSLSKTFDMTVTHMELFCKHCSTTPFARTHVGMLQSKMAVNRAIKSHNRNLDNIIYKFWGFTSSDIPETHISGKPFADTSDRLLLQEILNDNTRQLDYTMFRIEMRLLGDVLKNASIFTWCGLACSPSKLEHDDTLLPFLFFRAVGRTDYSHLHLHKRELHFVSCGSTQMAKLGFENLVSIFDLYFWIYLAITILIISVLSSYVFASDKSLNLNFRTDFKFTGFSRSAFQEIGFINYMNFYLIPSFISYIKALLEQGNPIITPLWNKSALRWIFGSYLLAVLVISNAYKNENITALTLPRAQIPPNTFERLVEFNFSIYTRNIVTGGVRNFMLRDAPLLPKFMENLFTRSNWSEREVHRVAVFRSELFFYDHAEFAFSNTFANLSNASKITKYYMNHTKLHPNWIALYLDSDDSCSIFNNKSYCDILRFCNKTAFLLPETDAKTKYYKMRNEGKDKAYLSKGKLLQMKYGLTVFRWIDPRVMSRLDGLYVSGLFDRWSNFITDFLPLIRSRFQEGHQPKPSDMNGNMSVIFFIGGGGLVLSIFSFLIELIPVFKIVKWNNVRCKIIGISKMFTKLLSSDTVFNGNLYTARK